MSTTAAPEAVFQLRDRVTLASIVVGLIWLAYVCSTTYDLAILSTGLSSICYFISASMLDIVLWYAAKRCTFIPLSPTMKEVVNVMVSIAISILLPDNVILRMVPWLKYVSLLWLLLQACIVIDMAHEFHAMILTRAEHSLHHRGSHAGRIHYAFHIILSIILLVITACMSTNLINLTFCDSLFLHFLALVCLVGTLVSLSERCNKGALIPAMVGLYSMLCCYDALLSTNHNTGYYYYAKCYYNSETTNSHLSPVIISATLGYYKMMTKWGLGLVSSACVLYAAAYGSPTIVFFYDRWLIHCCPSGCHHACNQGYLFLSRRCSSIGASLGWTGTTNNIGGMNILTTPKEDESSLVYQGLIPCIRTNYPRNTATFQYLPLTPFCYLHLPTVTLPDMTMDYRLALDHDIVMKLRSCEAGETIKCVSTETLVTSNNNNNNPPSSSLSPSSHLKQQQQQQQQSYTTMSSSGGRDQRLGLITNYGGNHHGQGLAEGSSLLPSSSSQSSSSSSSSPSSSSLALAGSCIYPLSCIYENLGNHWSILTIN